MYKSIIIGLDNSEHSTEAVELSLAVASSAGSRVTGCHVYAARLHNDRFIQMESGLPDKYQEEDELQRQREIHDSLITKGLEVISDSYMTVLTAKASSLGITPETKSLEGKNFHELSKEVSSGGYDLLALGLLGLGRVKKSTIGSVSERVLRRANCDVLIAKDHAESTGSTIFVCIDGSPRSFGALEAAIELSKVFGTGVTALAAFDPDYHYAAFRSIAGVLSDEAGKLFKFKEQEKLHEEVIDKGLAKIYSDHLDTARALASNMGVELKTTLLSGKPFEAILEHLSTENPFMVVLGRTGVHAEGDLDIGNNTENLVRQAPCHVLVTTGELVPEGVKKDNGPEILWTREAEDTLANIPPFARGVVKNLIEERARTEGLTTITREFMHKVRRDMDH